MAVVRGTDFDDVRIGSFETLPIRFLQPHHAERKRLRVHDILIETAGGTKGRPTGRTQLVKQRLIAHFNGSVTCASFARFLRIDEQKAHPEYVYWLLQALYAAGQLRQFNTQHTGVSRFQFTTFADTFQLHLPALPDQRRIAAILTAYDDLIENNTRRISILEEMARRLFEEWFVSKVDAFPVAGDAARKPKLPVGWTIRHLSEVASVTMGQSPPSKTYNMNNDGMAFHQGVKDFGDYFPTDRTYCTLTSTPRKAIEGDILFSVRAPVGRLNLALNEIILGRGLAAIRPKAQAHYLLGHLRHSFSEPDKMGGGTIYKSVNRSDIECLPIVWPADNLAHRFDQISADIWALIKALTLACRDLRSTRDLLLPKLLSGEIAVSKAASEAEAA